MELTQPVDWIGKNFIGYAMNAEFSDENARQLVTLMQAIQQTYNDGVFCTPKKSLHITLMDWVAPLVDYDGHDKDALFKKLRPEYDAAITEILALFSPITVRFDTLALSPTTIYIVGHDDGQFQAIREQFLAKVHLVPGTKLPPTIIHSSLARFTKPLKIADVEAFLAAKSIELTQQIPAFRLLHQTKEPTLEFTTVKRYPLA
ncbi:MAG TPA: hypothetical protein VM581_04310 [Magnetospirillaceae bacterium]|nr:hypothetical protein [Magnetospirillaceae bacterium]